MSTEVAASFAVLPVGIILTPDLLPKHSLNASGSALLRAQHRMTAGSGRRLLTLSATEQSPMTLLRAFAEKPSALIESLGCCISGQSQGAFTFCTPAIIHHALIRSTYFSALRSTTIGMLLPRVGRPWETGMGHVFIQRNYPAETIIPHENTQRTLLVGNGGTALEHVKAYLFLYRRRLIRQTSPA